MFFKSIKNFFQKYKSYVIVIFIILISVISVIFQNKKSDIVINDEVVEADKYSGKIAVYISGEVCLPGVYYIEDGARLNDLIEMCGGFTDLADITELNLAEKLNDSDKIDVPKKIIEEKSEESDTDNNLININKATKEELKTLDGIGDTLADNIIEYRKNNKFESIEDILNVNGIGESKYNVIKEYICVK